MKVYVVVDHDVHVDDVVRVFADKKKALFVANDWVESMRDTYTISFPQTNTVFFACAEENDYSIDVHEIEVEQ